MTPEEIKRIAGEGNVRSGEPRAEMDLNELIRALTQARSLGGLRVAVNTGTPLHHLGIGDDTVRLSMLIGVQLVEIEGDPDKWVIFQAQREE